MNRPRILLINPFGVGDVIFSSPLVETLRQARPASHICYICNKRAYEILKLNPHIDRIFVYEKDDYRQCWQHSPLACLKKIVAFLAIIKQERFDILIDLSLGYQTSLLMRLVGIRKRIGFNYRNRGKFLTDKIDIDGFNNRHVVEHYLDMLKSLGIEARSFIPKPKVYLASEDAKWADAFLKDNGIGEGETLIGMIPGCGASWGFDARYRRWDRKKFARVADGVIEKYGAKVVLLGDASEAWISADVEKMMKGEAVVACGKTTLGQALGMMKRCKIIITNDGGPLHMAVGLGVKTVSVFGPVDERVYGPYPAGPDHVVVSKKDMACRPCYKKFKYSGCDDRKCLSGITSDEVLDAVDKLLRP